MLLKLRLPQNLNPIAPTISQRARLTVTTLNHSRSTANQLPPARALESRNLIKKILTVVAIWCGDLDVPRCSVGTRNPTTSRSADFSNLRGGIACRKKGNHHAANTGRRPARLLPAQCAAGSAAL